MIPLFKQYPRLRDKLPYVSLGEFPTPVEKLHRLGQDIGVDELYVKRDDLSGKVYGGNKIRKLEFILGDAVKRKKKAVFGFGYAGSHHALATAIYARQLGLKSISILMPQPNARYVRDSLALSYHYGAELHEHRNLPFLVLGTLYQMVRHGLKYGYVPRYISPGGSSPLGTVGYVNAAFELKEQITSGEMPEPDSVYVALGTVGTAVGLMLGLKAANLKSQVVPVRVADEKLYANAGRMMKLFRSTSVLLHSLDQSFPELELTRDDVRIRGEFLGQGYAHFTEEGMEAARRMKETEGIMLDGTYTAKSLVALIHDASKEGVKGKTILFWNTHNSRDLTNLASRVDYRNLPACFHRYFEEDVQPLDRG